MALRRTFTPAENVEVLLGAGNQSSFSHRSRTKIQFFTISEIADLLRISTRTVRRRIESGELVSHRLGGAVRIAEPDLRAFLALHRES